MCLPVAAFAALGVSAQTAATLSAVGSVASLAGAGFGAFGAIQQGRATAAAAQYNAGLATANAAISKQNAAWTSQEGRAAAEAQSLKTRAEVGGIKANQAAGGIALDSGSAFDVRSSAAETGELNALNIRSNAARQAYGYQTESTNYEAQSGLDKSEAGNDLAAGAISGSSTLLGGVGNAASNYANFQLSSGKSMI